MGVAEAFKDSFNESSLSATALAENIGDVDDRIVAYAKTCKNGEFTMEGFKASLEKTTLSTKAATVGLKVLRVALNTIAISVLSIALGTVVKGIYNAIHAQEQMIDKAHEEVEENKKVTDSISELIQKYQELKNSESFEGEHSTEILEIQNQIKNTIGEQASHVDLVNGSLQDQLKILQQINNENLERLANSQETELALKNGETKASPLSAFWNTITGLFDTTSNWLGEKHKGSKALAEILNSINSDAVFKNVFGEVGFKHSKIQNLASNLDELFIRGEFTPKEILSYLTDIQEQIEQIDIWKLSDDGKQQYEIAIQYLNSYIQEYSKKVTEINQLENDYAQTLAKRQYSQMIEDNPISTYEDYIAFIKKVDSQDTDFSFFKNKNIELNNQKQCIKDLINVNFPEYFKTLSQLSATWAHSNDDAFTIVNKMKEVAEASSEDIIKIIDDTIDKIDTAKSVISKWETGQSLDSSDLTNILKVYPQLASEVQKYLNGLSNEETLINKIRDVEQQAISEYKDDMRLKTATQEQNVYSWAVLYQKDLNSYQHFVDLKNDVLDTFLQTCVNNNQNEIEELKKQYGDDLENYKALTKAKLEVAEKTMLNSGASYDTYSNALRVKYGGSLLDATEEELNKLSELQNSHILATSQFTDLSSLKKAIEDINAISIIDPNIPSSNDKNSSSSSKSKSALKTNDNYYNQYQAQVDDYKATIEKLTDDLDTINNKLEKAIETGNTELVNQLQVEADKKNTALRDYLASSAKSVREMAEKQILPIVYEIAPQLKGKKYSDITQKDLQAINKALEDAVIAEENAETTAKNNGNDDAYNSAAIKSAEMRQKIFESLLDTLEDIDSVAGNANGSGEWAEKWADSLDKVISRIKEFYDYQISISDYNADLFEKQGNYSELEQLYVNKLSLIANQAKQLRELGYKDTSSDIQSLQGDYIDTQSKLLENKTKQFEEQIKANEKVVTSINDNIDDLNENDYTTKIELLNELLPAYNNKLATIEAQQKKLTDSFGGVANMTVETQEAMTELDEQALETAKNIKETQKLISEAIRAQYEYRQSLLDNENSNLENYYELLDLANNGEEKKSNLDSRINNLTISIQSAYREIDRLRAEDAQKNADAIQTEIQRVYDATKKILDLRKEQYQAEYDELNRYIEMRDTLENWLVGEKAKYIKKTEKLIKESYAKGLIDAKTYIEQLSDVYISEFEQYQSEQQRLQQAAIDAIEKEIEAIEKAQDAKVDALEEEIDLLEKRKEELEDQLELYDKAKSAVDTLIDEETERLQEEIDKLEEKNNQQTKAIELAEKQQALAKAQQQKSAYIYRENEGWVYESNAQELADAQQDLAEYQREQQFEAEKQAIQDRIDALNEYKESWQDAVDAYEKAQDKIAASAVIGKDWEEYVLGLREDIVKKFGDEYYKLSDELENVVEKRIDSLNKEKDEITETADDEIEKLNDLKEAWSKALDIQDEIEGYTGGLEALIGAETDSYESRLALAENFATNYENTFKRLQQSTQQQIEDVYKTTQAYDELLTKAGIPLYSDTTTTSPATSTSYSTLTDNDIEILKRMRMASQEWSKTTDEDYRARLANYNQEMAKLLSFNANFDSHTGTWTDDEGRLLYSLLQAYESGETVTIKNNKSQDSNTTATNKATTSINSASNKISTVTQKNVTTTNQNTTVVDSNSAKTSLNTESTDVNTNALGTNTSQMAETITSNSNVKNAIDELTATIPELKEAFENMDFSSNSGSNSSSSSSDYGLSDISDSYTAYLYNKNDDQKAVLDEMVAKYGATLNGNILTLSNGQQYTLSKDGFQLNGSSSSSSSSNSSSSSSNSSSSNKMTDSEAIQALQTYLSNNNINANRAWTKQVYSTGTAGASDIVNTDGALSESLTSRYFVVKRNNAYTVYKAQWGDGTNSTKIANIGQYAKGTKGVSHDQFAIVDEEGEELLIHAQHGRPTFLTKGTGVIPHDLTENLMQLGTNPAEYIKNTVTAGNLYTNIIPTLPKTVNKTNDTVVQINGNLSFPNINSGNDAQKLIDALCTMSTKAIQRSMRR